MQNFTIFLMGQLLVALPKLAIAIVGLVLLHSRLRTSHQRAYRFGMLGFGAFLLGTLWTLAVSVHPQLYATQPLDRALYASLLTLANLVGYVLQITGWLCILAGILSDRKS